MLKNKKIRLVILDYLGGLSLITGVLESRKLPLAVSRGMMKQEKQKDQRFSV